MTIDFIREPDVVLEFQSHGIGGGTDAMKAVSIALDADGYPHTAYHDDGNHDLRHAHLDGQGWHIETVTSDGEGGRWASLAMVDDGKPHAAYYEATNGTVKYEYLTPHARQCVH